MKSEKQKVEELTTTLTLVFDTYYSSLVPPIHRLRQLFPAPKRVPIAQLQPTSPPFNPSAQIKIPVLVVGQIGKPSQPQLESPISGIVVVLVDEPEVVLEHLESPAFLVLEGVVGFAMLLYPRLEEAGDLKVGPFRTNLLAVLAGRDGGHVLRS